MVSIWRRSRIAAAAVMVALTGVAAAGCGGDDESPQARWASEFCGALSDWRSTVQESADTVRDAANLSANSLEEAATSAVDATRKLADDLEELGPPDTEAGDDAREEVETYRAALEADVQKLEDQIAAPSSGAAGLLQKISAVAATLASMATSLQTTVTAISEADVEGQLREALEDDSTCQELKESAP